MSKESFEIKEEDSTLNFREKFILKMASGVYLKIITENHHLHFNNSSLVTYSEYSLDAAETFMKEFEARYPLQINKE